MDKPQDAETLTLIYIIKSVKRNVNMLTRFFTKIAFAVTSKLDILTTETVGLTKDLQRRFLTEGEQTGIGVA
ncbi:MAG: hypothetical protein LUD78_04735 [Clostridiales bacterium]|nr:hypothetical protein [Clostridiales bacterium]